MRLTLGLALRPGTTRCVRTYEPDRIAAFHFGTFDADSALLRTFLTGYGWPVDDTFCRRAMSAALMHQFDVLAGVRDLVRDRGPATLDDLAVLLWDVGANPG